MWRNQPFGRQCAWRIIMSSTYVIALKSSPRPQSNSNALADQAIAGAQAAGAQVESIELHRMSIQPCDACDGCQGATDDPCVIEDDMQALYPKLRRADAIVIASPVYWFALSAQAKLCIDRWYALDGPQGSALAGKQFGLVLTYGDSDPFASGAINAIRAFQDMCRYIRAGIAGIVCGSASKPGDIQRQAEVMARAFDLGRKLAGGR